MEYQFISSLPELEKACDTFKENGLIGVDLEADSMHSFQEKICLIQICAADQAYLIDPFELKELTPFLAVLEDPNVVKVFHGSDF